MMPVREVELKPEVDLLTKSITTAQASESNEQFEVKARERWQISNLVAHGTFTPFKLAFVKGYTDNQ